MKVDVIVEFGQDVSSFEPKVRVGDAVLHMGEARNLLEDLQQAIEVAEQAEHVIEKAVGRQ